MTNGGRSPLLNSLGSVLACGHQIPSMPACTPTCSYILLPVMDIYPRLRVFLASIAAANICPTALMSCLWFFLDKLEPAQLLDRQIHLIWESSHRSCSIFDLQTCLAKFFINLCCVWFCWFYRVPHLILIICLRITYFNRFWKV